MADIKTEYEEEDIKTEYGEANIKIEIEEANVKTEYEEPNVNATAEIEKLSTKTRYKYDNNYDQFKKWQKDNDTGGEITEDLLLEYYGDLRQKNAPNTLWTIHSMLKASINANDDVDIKKFKRLAEFVKAEQKDYKPKKAPVFSDKDIKRFLTEAPDEIHLANKVIAIFGILGGCSSGELLNMKPSYIEEQGEILLGKIPKTKSHKARCFTISGEYCKTVKKYMDLRPKGQDRFFLNYQKEKITKQPIGKHKIGNTPHAIAEYLELENPKQYTGHSFKRTSTKLLANAGAEVLTIKHHVGWASSSMTQEYIEESEIHRSSQLSNINMNEINSDMSMIRDFTFNNCTVTINVNPSKD